MSRRVAALPGLALALIASGVAFAQEAGTSDTIRYRLSWDNPAAQLYTVEVTASAAHEPIVFSLPAWRPGRYILQNYAANVQSVRARNDQGRPLRADWLDLDSWRVEPDGARQVTLAYEWYAATLDAGSSLLRPDLAYFNPVNLLPWVEGRIEHPVYLTLEVADDWEVATQLSPTGSGASPGELSYVASDYHALADSPTIAVPDFVEWQFSLDEVPYHVVFRTDSPLDLGERSEEEILADLEAIAREQTAMFGGAPYDQYWFLYQLVPYPFGHAVEHAASSSYVLQDIVFTSDERYQGFLSVTAHELFHAWNVKRIRPAALWPYDYSEPQLTHLHWFTEGVTSYYDNLTLARTALITDERYFQLLGDNIQALQTSPGRLVTSAALASWTSWHSGYGAGNPNQSISFYTKGSLIGLLLDLVIRDATDGARSLDDVMRGLFEQYYRKGQGVPEDGVRRMAEEVSGRPLDAFFAAYVDGVAELPYDSTLAIVGLTTRLVPDTTRPVASLGMALRQEGDELRVTTVRPDGPALEAGLMRGDAVVSIDGDSLGSANLDSLLMERDPGEEISVRIRRLGNEMDRTLTLAAGGNLDWKVVPLEDPTERQLGLRESWLASSTEE